MKGELWRLVSVVASWLSGLWRLQSDTLGSSPSVASFSLFSFLPEQGEFHLNLRNNHLLYVCTVYMVASM